MKSPEPQAETCCIRIQDVAEPATVDEAEMQDTIENQCIICLENKDDAILIECGHRFCTMIYLMLIRQR